MTLHADVASLLRAHSLTNAEEAPLIHTGFSGATLTRLIRTDGASFVLKRMAIDRDWIMAATDDASCREVQVADASPILGKRIRTPALGVARDGRGYALLMRDITEDLIPPGVVSRRDLETIIADMADFHGNATPAAGVSWCDLRRRLTLLTPASAQIARAYGAPVAQDIIAGWEQFAVLAPPAVRRLVSGLSDDPSPLLEALDRMEAVTLHGDLKLDNIGLAADGRMWLIDWALTLIAPAAVELGWFLAINSRRLPLPLHDVMSNYADAARIPDAVRARHDGLTILCGLLLRGWRKALDAREGEPDELEWWCAKAAEAARLL